jgi:predicted RecB family endonuclease
MDNKEFKKIFDTSKDNFIEAIKILKEVADKRTSAKIQTNCKNALLNLNKKERIHLVNEDYNKPILVDVYRMPGSALLILPVEEARK